MVLTKIMFTNLKIYTNLIIKRYAGHSKWQNIRHIKAAKDAQKSAMFLKFSKQMKVAVQEGGTVDVKRNLKLDHIIQQAKRLSMPQATIQSILKSCENDKSNSKSHLLEIKGPGSCIILCEIFTNNIHHFKQSLAAILKKHASRYSDGGGIHLFEEKGIIITEILPEYQSESVDKVLEFATDHAIECGAEEVRVLDDDALQFLCGTTNLKNVEDSLEKLNYKIFNSSVEFIPLKYQQLTENDLQVCSNLYGKLENLPEIVRVSDNIA